MLQWETAEHNKENDRQRRIQPKTAAYWLVCHRKNIPDKNKKILIKFCIVEIKKTKYTVHTLVIA